MDGKPARSVSLTDFEKDAIRHLCLLTMKPIIYVTNVAESDLADPGNNSHVKEVMDLASELQSGIVTISAQVRQCHATETINRTVKTLVSKKVIGWDFFFKKFQLIFILQVEAELTELPPEERIEYLTSLGVNESGLGNLIRATYSLLGLRTYFTSGEKVTEQL